MDPKPLGSAAAILSLFATVLLGWAGSASAASIGMTVVGGTTFSPGDPITIEIDVVLGQGEPVAPGFDLRLQSNGGITWTGASQVTLTSSNGALPWVVFPPICSGADPCIAVNTQNPVPTDPLEVDPFTGVLGTATGIVGASSFTLALQISSVPPDNTFFGAPAPPPQQIQVIPEPGTAALVGLVLLGLGIAAGERWS